jgi:hypothetical protein
MTVIFDIFINLIAGFIGFGLGWLWEKFLHFLKFRKVKQFWRPFFQKDVQMVLGRFLEYERFEPSGFLGVGDANGLAELQTQLKTLGLADIPVAYADCIDGDHLKSNLILLGGPDGNLITRDASQKLQLTLRFGDHKKYEVSFVDTRGVGQIYAPYRNRDTNSLEIDYGLIIRTRNPFAPDMQMLIIAGGFGFGTWAAVRFILSKEFLDNAIVSRGDPFECLIETDVTRGIPQDIRLMALRSLSE